VNKSPVSFLSFKSVVAVLENADGRKEKKYYQKNCHARKHRNIFSEEDTKDNLQIINHSKKFNEKKTV